jgi:hypothetical protein
MIYNNISIKINNFNDFNDVQFAAFRLGLKWKHLSNEKKQYLYGNQGVIGIGCVILIEDNLLSVSYIHQANSKIISSNEYIKQEGYLIKPNCKIISL